LKRTGANIQSWNTLIRINGNCLSILSCVNMGILFHLAFKMEKKIPTGKQLSDAGVFYHLDD
ncbi:MAG TPA: hypothetical protein VMT35_19970, partial [Ignavibacteriaceae bacterium]|nr:hypothetical protein [Ignavibacteriaceae bacterium]